MSTNRLELLGQLGLEEHSARAFELFNPFALKKTLDLISTGGRLVHYTSAEVALSILRKREVWMRKSSTMNDFKEIEYGMECLATIWGAVPGIEFQKFLDEAFPGLSKRLVTIFNGWLPHFRTETYLTCLSEHLDSEDVLGRLSMWRAYGGEAGVALVLNNRAFTVPAGDLGAITSPVAYLTPSAFEGEWAELFNSLHQNRGFVQELGEEAVLAHCFHALKMAVLCTKHPGFHEEKEWRVIHSPTQEPSRHLRAGIEVVRGSPQRVYKIPLQEITSASPVARFSPNDILDHVIIGPSSHPHEIAQAFIATLEEAGVERAASKIAVSDIPLRQR